MNKNKFIRVFDIDAYKAKTIDVLVEGRLLATLHKGDELYVIDNISFKNINSKIEEGVIRKNGNVIEINDPNVVISKVVIKSIFTYGTFLEELEAGNRAALECNSVEKDLNSLCLFKKED